ncbi:MAG: flavodoxin family protein [Bacteroidales bacterium]|nr:flavodoxin family protein [Bacteroidales bacterium]
MNSLIVYDSQYGNTEKIAKTLAKILHGCAICVTKFKSSDLKNVDLLILGSPTQGGRATVAMQNFLTNISSNIRGLKIAVFDTRIPTEKLNPLLKMLLKIIGYASPKIASVVINAGGKLIVKPEGFFVEGKEGPLAANEIERIKVWGKSVAEKTIS